MLSMSICIFLSYTYELVPNNNFHMGTSYNHKNDFKTNLWFTYLYQVLEIKKLK